MKSTLYAVVSLACFGSQIALAEPLVLSIASTFPPSMPILGDVSRKLPERIAAITDGDLTLRFHAPGELVPAADSVNAVASGRVAGAWAGAGWFAAKDGAFNLFSSVPFGPDMGEYMAWLYKGGGLTLAREMFAEHDIHNIPCGLIPPEASGWFRKEIRTVGDLKGLKMRFFGLGARVMQRFGVETKQLAPGEILPAMAKGELDAAEFSLPAMDKPLGLQRVAKYYYFPGWHQQATLFDLYINKRIWNALPPKFQATLETVCGDAMRETIAEGEAAQWKAMQELQAEGVVLKRWSPEILVAFESAWSEVVAEEMSKSERFRKAWDSFSSFRKNYAIWRHFNSLL